jgi:hypothetical protein
MDENSPTIDMQLVAGIGGGEASLNPLKKGVCDEINKFVERDSYQTQAGKIFLAFQYLMPFDAAAEINKVLPRLNDKAELGSYPERLLVLMAIITLANLLDAFYESEPEFFSELTTQQVMAISISISKDYVLSLAELVSLVDDWLVTYLKYQDFSIEFLSILNAQNIFSKKVLERSIEEACAYRAATVGKYNLLLSKIAANPWAYQSLAHLQFSDDIVDVLEDDGVQIQPLVSLMQKYGIKIDESAFNLFMTLSNLGESKFMNMLIDFNQNRKFTVEIPRDITHDMNENPRFSNELSKDQDLHDFLLDWMKIRKFYLVDYMQLESTSTHQ